MNSWNGCELAELVFTIFYKLSTQSREELISPATTIGQIHWKVKTDQLFNRKIELVVKKFYFSNIY